MDIIASVITQNSSKIQIIEGDYGSGKTTLVNHVLNSAKARYDKLIIGRGQCSGIQHGFDAFVEAFIDILDQAGNQKIINIGGFLLDIAPAWIELLPIVGGISSAVIDTLKELRRVSQQKHTFTAENIFIQFSNSLNEISKKRAIIIYIDDFHWADEGSLRLFNHLAQKLQNQPVLIIVAYRPIEALEFGEHRLIFKDILANLLEKRKACKISLGTGRDQYGIQVNEYIQKRYPKNEFPVELANWVQEITRGHPLYVEQLFSLWEENRAIVQENNFGEINWRLKIQFDWHEPHLDSLGKIIESRINHLDEQLREILRYAATEGEVFTAQVIGQILTIGESLITKELASLEKYQFVEHKDNHNGARVLDLYQFVYRFFRDVIYENISDVERRYNHKEIAQKLESLYYPDTASIAIQLATHFEKAELWEKAAKYILQAAINEEKRNGWFEVANLCKKGLNITNDVRLRINFFEKLGDSYYHLGKYEDAELYYLQVLQEIQKSQCCKEREALICEKIADVCWFIGKSSEIISFINQGKQSLSDHPDPSGIISIRLDAQEAWVAINEGNNEEAIHLLLKLLERCQELESSEELEILKVRIYNWLGIAYSNLCRYRESTENYYKSIEIAERINEVGFRLTSLNNLAYDFLIQQKFDESEALITKVLNLASRIGDIDNEALARSNRVSILLALQKPLEAIEESNQILKLIGENSWQLPYVYADLALAYLNLSSLEMAYRKALKAYNLARKLHGSIEVLAQTTHVLAQVEQKKGNINSAISLFEKASELYMKEGNHYFPALVQYNYAKALIDHGKYAQAKELIKSALRIFCELGFENMISDCKTLLKNLPEDFRLMESIILFKCRPKHLRSG